MSDGFADLAVQNDVLAELAKKWPRLAWASAMQTLEYIVDRNGEVRWSWEGIKPQTRELVADLIESGLLVEREHVTHALQVHGQLTLRLTDKGRNIVEIQRQKKIVASKVQAIPS